MCKNYEEHLNFYIYVYKWQGVVVIFVQDRFYWEVNGEVRD